MGMQIEDKNSIFLYNKRLWCGEENPSTTADAAVPLPFQGRLGER